MKTPISSRRTATCAAPRPTSISFWPLEAQRRDKQAEVDQLNRQANEVSKSIGQAKDPAEREARKDQGRKLRDKTTAAQADAGRHQQPSSTRFTRRFPTCRTPTRRPGPTIRPNLELRKGKTPLPKFDFKPLDHVTLGERLELFDFEGGAKVAGHGFYFLMNDAVLLELALQRYALDLLIMRRVHADDHARPGANEILQGHRLHPAVPRRRSTASPTAI